MSKKYSVKPSAADFSFKNPLKGYRSGLNPQHNSQAEYPYTSLMQTYFRWNMVERSKDDSAEHIMEICDERWQGLRENNIKVVARVSLLTPNSGDHTLANKVVGYYPDDMLQSTLDSPEFFGRVRNLIMKLGKAWDNDPRVAYIETGLYGLWGEQHEDSMSKPAVKNLCEAYLEAFPHKKMMLRKPKNGARYKQFGTYWDSFAHADEENYAQDAKDWLDWRTGVMGGELAHNWGRYWIQPGKDYNATFSDPKHFNHFMDYIWWQHNNHLGSCDYHELNDEAKKGFHEFYKASGYRYILEKVEYSVENGQLQVDFDVKNIGASPMYYKWPVRVYLLDKSKKPVWHGDFNEDITKWLPGDEYNFESREYDIPAETNHVSGRFRPDLPEGEYYLCLAVCDPASDAPSLRFATTNYFNGGYAAIGRIGIGCDVDEAIDPRLFDDVRADHSLKY